MTRLSDVERLRGVKRLDLERLKISGVYFLIKQGEVVYVGKSVDIFGRVSTHIEEAPGFYEEALFIEVQPEHLNDVESAFIVAIQPSLNSKVTRLQGRKSKRSLKKCLMIVEAYGLRDPESLIGRLAAIGDGHFAEVERVVTPSERDKEVIAEREAVRAAHWKERYGPKQTSTRLSADRKEAPKEPHTSSTQNQYQEYLRDAKRWEYGPYSRGKTIP